MRLDNGTDVGRQLGVFVFTPHPAAHGEILQTTDAVARLFQTLGDGVASPTEPPFGDAGTAASEFGGDLGLKQSSLMSRQSSRPRAEQGVDLVGGVVHVEYP